MRKIGTWGLGLVLASGGVVVAAGTGGVTDYVTSIWQERMRAREVHAMTEFDEVVVKNKAGKQVGGIIADPAGNGMVLVTEPTGATPRAAMMVTATGAGRLVVWSSAGVATYGMDGDQGIGSLTGDVAEMFPASEAIEPGSVVVIDALSHGAMRAATSPYDRRVAGVVAGAKDYKSAITLRSMEQGADRVPVTLTGTAYCLATNANGAIKAGDLLTSSAVPGHAMKVTDHDAARGAILGKALEDLKADKGHILILASLQ